MQVQERSLIGWLALGACSWKIASLVSALLAAPLVAALPRIPRDITPDSYDSVGASLSQLVVWMALNALVRTFAYAAIGAGLAWVMLWKAGVPVSGVRWIGCSTLVILVLDGASIGSQYGAFVVTESRLLIGLIGLSEAFVLAVAMAWTQGRILHRFDPTLAQHWRRAALVGWCVVALVPFIRAVPLVGHWLAWSALLAPGALPALALWRVLPPAEDVRATPEVPSEAPPVQ